MRLAPVLAMMLTVLAVPAFATEDVIRFPSAEGTVVGTLSLPMGAPAPVVLLFHGFTGTRDELAVAGTEEGVFSRTARLLREAGYASLRIDFRGSGDSSGEFADTTFEGQIADGMQAVSVMSADPRVMGDTLAIIGWSQGGLVAAAVAGRSGVPDALALWAAVAKPQETFAGILGADVLTRGLASGEAGVSITLPWGAQLDLRQGFFDGIATLDPVAEIAAYKGPLFVAHGRQDTTVLPAAADAFIAAHDGKETLMLADMDHVFNVFAGPETLDQLVAATIAFFDAQVR